MTANTMGLDEAVEWLRDHVSDLRSTARVLRESPWGAKLAATAAEIDKAADEGALAIAALEAARKDTERLDWLDANGSAVRLKGNSRRNLIIWDAVHVPSYRTIRHAIDHAREEEEGNGQ
jgi:hypothetical protein